MSGYLRARGLVVARDRVRQSLRRIDPLSSAGRWSRAVTRRTYNVPTPNSLWHIDAHMKLVRYTSHAKTCKLNKDRHTSGFVLLNYKGRSRSSYSDIAGDDECR